MTLEHISELSQAIAAVAVLISLIYLALQTRLSAKSQRAMVHGARAEWVESVVHRIGHPDFADVWRAGAAADPDISPAHAHQFLFFTMGHLIGFQNNLLDWREGLIDSERWAQSRRAMRGYLSFPGYRATYALQREAFHPDFRVMADADVADTKGQAGADLGSAWLTLAAQERAAIGATAT